MLTLTSHTLRLSLAPEIGAGITDFSLLNLRTGAFTPLMRRAAPDEPNASNFASFIMAPWVNRIRGGQFSFNGTQHTLRTNTPPPDNMAQHGDVRKRPWRLTMSATNAATLEFDSRDHPDTNWPWPFAARAIFTLLGTSTGSQLRIDLLIRNLSSEVMPTACGHHPYFMRTLWNKDDQLYLKVPVAARYPLESGCATGAPAQDDLTRQLRTGGPLPNHPIDDVFIADSTTQNTAELHWPASKVRLKIKASPNLSHWVVYAPPAPGTPALRAGSSSDSSSSVPFTPLPYIAVEPQSAVNNALNLANQNVLGTGTIPLNPREELNTTCIFEVESH